MGLLDDVQQFATGLLSGGKPYRDAIAGLLSGNLDTVKHGISQLGNFPTRAQVEARNPAAMNASTFLNDPGVNAALGFAPMGIAAHTVWHGSPHKFNKFDMSKIGTGEGAQAYGHGLYFAENDGVANEYARRLSDPVINFLNKKPETELEQTILRELLQEAKIYGARSTAVHDKWLKMSHPMKDILYGNSYVGIKPLQPEQLAQRLALRDAAVGLGPPSVSDTGNLYKVDIPDEILPRMLDWDKPLSKQHPDVQKAISKLKNNPSWNALVEDQLGGPVMEQATGRDLYKAFENNKQSNVFENYGIPGIRYLDGNSRGTGGGSSNFVIFDDSLPKILERNGVPTGQEPWAKGGWKGLLQK